MTQIENFQANTFETLFNLPSWVVYIFVFIFAISILAGIYMSVAKWYLGFDTVKYGIDRVVRVFNKPKTNTPNTKQPVNSNKNNS